MLQSSLYTISLLCDDLLAAKKSKAALLRTVQDYLKAGCHPFFLQQGLWHAHWQLPESSYEDAQLLLHRPYKKYPEVCKPGHGLSGPLERIYISVEEPRQVHDGVLQGAFLECYASLTQWNILKQLPKNWENEWDKLVKDFLRHPGANVVLVENMSHLENVFRESKGYGKFDQVADSHHQLFCDFISARANKIGVAKVVEEILRLWTPAMAFYVFSLMRMWQYGSEFSSEQAISILQTILGLAEHGKGQLKQSANSFLQYHLGDKDDALEESYVSGNMAHDLVFHAKASLDKPEAFHAVVNWFKRTNKKNLRNLIFNLAAEFRGSIRVDKRSESLVEQLVGRDAWQALSELTNSKHWEDPGTKIPNLYYGLDQSTQEYQLYVQKLAECAQRLKVCDHALAESSDKLTHSSGCTLADAGEIWDSMMQLMSGDVVSIVSPLRHSWMALERKPWEFLSEEFPKAEVAAHPNLEPKGAASKFRLYSSVNPENPVIGTMDTEGKMELENIIALTPLARLAIQAIVVQSLAAVMVPRHVEGLAKAAGRGPQLLWEGEVFASRPVVHVVGKLSKPTDQEDEPTIDSIHRIHPIIAMWLFQWLLDEETDWEPQLYRMFYDEIDGGDKEYFFAPWPNAKNLLKAKQVPLSEVFHNTVRAHTRPVPVYMDKGGSIIVRQVSDRALRNYGRFLRYGGRQLDLRPVRKTYELEKGGRLVMDVPRTFNQGTFNSLDQVWQMVPDLSLKAQAKEKFKF